MKNSTNIQKFSELFESFVSVRLEWSVIFCPPPSLPLRECPVVFLFDYTFSNPFRIRSYSTGMFCFPWWMRYCWMISNEEVWLECCFELAIQIPNEWCVQLLDQLFWQLNGLNLLFKACEKNLGSSMCGYLLSDFFIYLFSSVLLPLLLFSLNVFSLA